MVAAKTFQEWYAFFGGKEMNVSRDEAVVVWEAATTAAEARFKSHNSASTPLKCVRCGVNGVSDFCAGCVQKMLKESNAL